MDFLHPLRGRDARPVRYWPQLWALVLLVPATLAVTEMSLTMCAVACLLVFGLPTVMRLAMTAEDGGALRAKLPAAVRFGACAGVTFLGFGGLFTFSGWLAWAALAAYAATALWAHHAHVPRSPVPAVLPAPPDEPVDLAPRPVHVVTPEEVHAMTDEELCHAWRRSFVTLSTVRGVAQRAEVVRLRQALLDEVEARHPAGLRAWLRSGARAAGGPERYLDHTDEDGTTEAA